MWLAFVNGDTGGESGALGPGRISTPPVCFAIGGIEVEPNESYGGSSGGDIRLLMSQAFFDSIGTGDGVGIACMSLTSRVGVEGRIAVEDGRFGQNWFPSYDEIG